MPKQLNVALNFTANTTQAKQSVTELSNLLTKIAYGTNINVSATGINQASAAAKELAFHLNKAYDATTGNFDLSKLNTSLKQAGTNITQLSTKLLTAGETGQQAFVKLAQSISQANAPIMKTNGLLTQMWTTMQNTLRWQISSSILHGFMGAIQKAGSYAKDLNKSLNNIRIVTGNSTEQMARFAEEANKAAKALNTTTTTYTDAALIYYQQGLSDKEVKARTDVTVKMANVAGENADTIASEMTAVWNNFNKAGDQAEEHFADVMTKLGAETASSTKEIANGLEKFAAISDTVGLSFDYAAAALATVTATTRESADVVGTAFKTIFGRLEGLKLGETLDDGTDLNKYSQALLSVGVNIKDASGKLKDMDTILDELGESWKGLSEDQQVALAETVGGMRQYNQMMALMGNWDFFKENLDRARNSDGTLQAQADIYAESWEAARKKVKASMESLYSDLLDDKFFINLNNGFAQAIDGVDDFIDHLGGIKPLLISIGSLILSSVANKITPALQQAIQNLTIMAGGARRVYNKMSQEMSQNINSQIANGNYNVADKQALINAAQLSEAKNKLSLVSKNLTDTEKAQYELELQGLELHQQEIQTIANNVLSLQQEKKHLEEERAEYEGLGTSTQSYKEQLNELITRRNELRADSQTPGSTQDDVDAYNRARVAITDYQEKMTVLNTTREQMATTALKLYTNETQAAGSVSTASGMLADSQALLKPLIQDLDTFGTMANDASQDLWSLKGAVLAYTDSIPQAIIGTKEIDEAIGLIDRAQTRKDLSAGINKLTLALGQAEIPAKDLEKTLKDLLPPNIAQKVITNIKQMAQEASKLKVQAAAAKDAFNDFNPKHTVTALEAIGATASGLSSAAMAVNMVTSALKTLNDENATSIEKITATTMAISMLIPSLTAVGKMFGTLSQTSLMQTASSLLLNTKLWANHTITLEADISASIQKIATDNATKAATDQLTAAELKEAQVLKATEGVKLLLNKAQLENVSAKGKEIIATELANGATLEAAVNAAVAAGAIDGETAALILEAGAARTATTATASFMATALPVVAVVAALAAVVYGLVKAFKNAKENTPEAELKRLKGASDQLAESANNSAEALRSLQEDYNDYTKIIEGLKDCTNEADAFYKKLLEANEAKKELQDAYGDYMEGYKIANDGKSPWVVDPDSGRLVLSDDFFDYIKNITTGQQIGAVLAETAADTFEASNTATQDRYAYDSAYGAMTMGTEWNSPYAAEHTSSITDVGRSQIFKDNLFKYFAIADSLTAPEQENAIKNLIDEKTYNELTANSTAEGLAYSDFQGFLLDQVRALEDNYAGIDFHTLASTAMQSAIATDQMITTNGALNYNSILANLMATTGSEFANLPQATDYIASSFEDTVNKAITTATNTVEGYEAADLLKAAQIADPATYGKYTLSNNGKKIKDAEGNTVDDWTQLQSAAIGQVVYDALNTNATKTVFKKAEEAYNTSVKGQIQASDIESTTLLNRGELAKALKGLDKNGTISPENYKALTDINSELSQFFTITKDGTWQLVTDADLFQQAIDDIDIEKLQSSISTLNTQKNTIEEKVGGPETAKEIAELSVKGETFEAGSTSAIAQESLVNAVFGEGYWASVNLEDQASVAKAAGETYLNLATQIQTAETSLATFSDSAHKLTRLGVLEDTQEYGEGLVRLGSQYDECTEEVSAYQKALAKNNGDIKRCTTEQRALAKAVKDAEWRKATADVKKFVDELANKKSKKEIQEQYDGIAQAFSDAFDINVTSDWVEENIELIKKWRNSTGQEAQSLAVQLQALAAIDDTESINIPLDLDKDHEIDHFMTNIETLKGILEANPITVDANGNADFTALIAALVEAGVTAEGLATILAQIGATDLSFDVDGTPINYDPSDPASLLEALNNWNANTVVKGYAPPVDSVDMTQITPSGAGGGGSSKKPKKKDIERYHEDTTRIDDLTKAYERASRAKDKLYGARRVAAIDAEIKATDALIKQQEAYIAHIEANSSPDLAKMQEEISKYLPGTVATIGEDGMITNWTDIMNAAADKYKADTAEDADEKWDDFEKAITQYEETLDLLQEQQAQLEEYILQRQELVLEQLNEKLQIKIQIDENDLKMIEIVAERMANNFAKYGEMIAKMSETYGTYNDKYSAYETYVTDLDKKLKDNEINSAQYVEAMQGAYDNLLDAAKDLMAYDEKMLDYYGQALDDASAKLDPYLNQLEHINSVFEHYSNILDLTSKKDVDYYKKKKTLLQGVVTNTENEYNVAKEYYNTIVAQKKATEKLWDTVKNNPNAPNYDEIKKQWDAVCAAEQEAHERMLEDAEAWVESINSLYETMIDNVIDEWDRAMSNGFGLDTLLEQMSNLSTYQEEWLANTNKIYEMNKLLRKVTAEMDKTNNVAAKQRLANYAKELEQKRESGEMTQLELEIEQAKYEQLLAQIALEEAKNAKSKVMLTQDSEGNFGYIYTADQDSIDEAEQNLEDANNNLFNIGLNGSREYGEKLVKEEQRHLNAMAEIEKRTDLDIKERQKLYDKETEQYEKNKETYLRNFTTSVNLLTDETAQALGWTVDEMDRNYWDLVKTTQLTKKEIVGYTEEIISITDEWGQKVDSTSTTLKKDLGDVETETKNLTNDSNALYKEVKNNLIPTLQTGLTGALSKVSEYIDTQRTKVQELIDKYIKLGSEAKAALEVEANKAPEKQETPPPKTDTTQTETPKVEQKATKYFWVGIGSNRVFSDDIGNSWAYDTPMGRAIQSAMDRNVSKLNWIEQSIAASYVTLPAGFASGGYTGEWGPEGRLALLHQKELVLNADDTENILKSVDIIHKIATALDLNTLWNRASMAHLSASSVGDNNQILEQTVTITAEFPNARDRNEIEAAFGDLLNRASQYANR